MTSLLNLTIVIKPDVMIPFEPRLKFACSLITSGQFIRTLLTHYLNDIVGVDVLNEGPSY